jgi:hypothetical protein
MKNPEDKLKGLLESRCDLYSKMQKLLSEQKELLEQKNIDGFNGKCDDGDKIVSALKNIDYEIARLESIGDITEAAKGDHENKKLRNLLNRAVEYARKNEVLAKELAGHLTEARQEIREKLEGTITMSRIGGYRPFSANHPIYVDKRN